MSPKIITLGLTVASLSVAGVYLFVPFESEHTSNAVSDSPRQRELVVEELSFAKEELNVKANKVLRESIVSDHSIYDEAAFAELSPRERAFRFLELTRVDLESAGDLLASGADWLEHEKEGLASVLFEEVVREKDAGEIAGWLARLSDTDEEFGLGEFLLHGALETPGLITDPEVLLACLLYTSPSPRD